MVNVVAFPSWVHKGYLLQGLWAAGGNFAASQLHQLCSVQSATATFFLPPSFTLSKARIADLWQMSELWCTWWSSVRVQQESACTLASTTTDTALFLHVQDSNTSLLDFCKPGCPLGAPLAASPNKPHFLHFLPGFQCSSAT